MEIDIAIAMLLDKDKRYRQNNITTTVTIINAATTNGTTTTTTTTTTNITTTGTGTHQSGGGGGRGGGPAHEPSPPPLVLLSRELRGEGGVGGQLQQAPEEVQVPRGRAGQGAGLWGVCAALCAAGSCGLPPVPVPVLLQDIAQPQQPGHDGVCTQSKG
jgi:hypothetical protein